MKPKSFKDDEESSTTKAEKIIFIALALGLVGVIIYFVFNAYMDVKFGAPPY